MSDREARDIARQIKKNTPSPKKKSQRSSDKNEEDKENNVITTCRKAITFPTGDSQQNNKQNCDEKGDFSHPVYKEISHKNGQINKSDLSTLKKMCRDEHIDSSGKRPLIQQRLKTYFKNKMLKEAGILNRSEKFDYFVIVDFEATCEEKNAPDYPHEIIEFPGVIVDGNTGKVMDSWQHYCRPTINSQLSEFCTTLTGIQQETVDDAQLFPEVLNNFNDWLESHGLGLQHTFALVTDGPFDVGRFLRLSCLQHQLDIPDWAKKWVNLRKGFANFYRWNSSASQQKLPGLPTMLSRLDMEFVGSPHCGLDDAKNIARVVSRMVLDGAILKVNEMLDPATDPNSSNESDNIPKRPPSTHKPRLSHVSPLSRTQAELWLSNCRQITKGCKELKL